MNSRRPSQARAFLIGSLVHFLVAVAIPALVAVAAMALHSRKLTGDLFFLFVLISSAMGVLFLFHELVVLLALAYLRRRDRALAPERNLAVDLLTTVIGADLLALVTLAAALVWFKLGGPEELVPFLGLFAPALYGVWLLACRIREAMEPLRGLNTPSAGATPEPASIGPRAPSTWGLQVYVTAVVAILAFAALGWRQDALGTFGIAIISISMGRIAGAIAANSGKRESRDGE